MMQLDVEFAIEKKPNKKREGNKKKQSEREKTRDKERQRARENERERHTLLSSGPPTRPLWK